MRLTPGKSYTPLLEGAEAQPPASPLLATQAGRNRPAGQTRASLGADDEEYFPEAFPNEALRLSRANSQGATEILPDSRILRVYSKQHIST